MVALAGLFAPAAAPANPGDLQPYLGLLHAHSGYSDGNMGEGELDRAIDAYEFARDQAGLDFLAVTDHNHAEAGFTLDEFRSLMSEADEANEPGRFVALHGIEWGFLQDDQAGGGHFNYFQHDKLIGWDRGEVDVNLRPHEYRRLARILTSSPGPGGTLMMINHPERDDFDGLFDSYETDFDHGVRLIEVLNGPAFSPVRNGSDRPRGDYERLFFRALSLGYRLGPTADQDNHHANWGLTNGQRTVAWAPRLDREAVMGALIRGRVSATSSPELLPWLELGGVPQGGRLDGAEAPLVAEVTVLGALAESARIEILRGLVGDERAPEQAGSGASVEVAPAGESETAWVLARVTVGEDRAWTAPVWVSGDPVGNLPPDFDGLAAARRHASTFVLTWSGATDPERDYPIKYRVLHSAGWDEPDAEVPLVETRQAGVVLEGLDPTGYHAFRVVAVDDLGAADANAVVHRVGTPPPDPEPEPQPEPEPGADPDVEDEQSAPSGAGGGRGGGCSLTGIGGV